MIVSSASIGAQYFLDGTANLQKEQIRTQREISSGFRIQDAADSPSQTPELVALTSRLVAHQNWQTNLTRVQAEANAADTALGSAIQLIDSARTIALQGAGTTANA